MGYAASSCQDRGASDPPAVIVRVVLPGSSGVTTVVATIACVRLAHRRARARQVGQRLDGRAPADGREARLDHESLRRVAATSRSSQFALHHIEIRLDEGCCGASNWLASRGSSNICGGASEAKTVPPTMYVGRWSERRKTARDAAAAPAGSPPAGRSRPGSARRSRSAPQARRRASRRSAAARARRSPRA